MHTENISLDHITKVEGAAALDVEIKDGVVQNVDFKITEYKRFFVEAMVGKKITEIPSMLSRICGTCSNAHLMCSIKACENALGITPSEQTVLLRTLTMHGLNIRDHALHLYLFVMPDLYGKDAFLDFDEDDEEQHQLLHDAFDIKAAGNHLALLVAGRSVHAMHPTIGGFIKVPDEEGIKKSIEELKKIRPAVLRLIKIFKDAPYHFVREPSYMAMISEDYDYMTGCIQSGDGECIPEEKYIEHLERVEVPYSQADAYKFQGESYMVGSIARMNLSKQHLHENTKKDAAEALELFPSNDVYHNNLAQAIEILHSIDASIELLENNTFEKEEVIKKDPKKAVGIGVVEAPRGTLYHKVEVGDDGIVTGGEVAVPTGQNQVHIEEGIKQLVQELLEEKSKEEIAHEIEKLIRAYDPCMSCASHFLKVNWLEE